MKFRKKVKAKDAVDFEHEDEGGTYIVSTPDKASRISLKERQKGFRAKRESKPKLEKKPRKSKKGKKDQNNEVGKETKNKRGCMRVRKKTKVKVKATKAKEYSKSDPADRPNKVDKIQPARAMIYENDLESISSDLSSMASMDQDEVQIKTMDGNLWCGGCDPMYSVIEVFGAGNKAPNFEDRYGGPYDICFPRTRVEVLYKDTTVPKNEKAPEQDFMIDTGENLTRKKSFTCALPKLRRNKSLLQTRVRSGLSNPLKRTSAVKD
jgi:hypothetical protein